MNYYLTKKTGRFTNGKYYPTVQRSSLVTTKQLAARIQERCTVTRPDILAVIDALVSQMNYSLQAGEKVLLDGFGYFYLNIISSGSDTEEEFDVNKNVKAIRCRFLPVATRNTASGAVTRTFSSGVTLRKVDLTSSTDADTDADTNE